MGKQTEIKASILDMAMGAIKERVDYEMAAILDNIMDPNTEAASKRKLTLTLELKPDADRRTINVSCSAKSTLVPTNPVYTSLYVGADRKTGEMQVMEMVPQVPGQQSMDGGEQDAPKVLNFKRA